MNNATRFNYSFIIPTFNRSQHLRTALIALNSMDTDKEETYEVIIVDDGSNENLLSELQLKKWRFSYKYIFLPRNIISSRSRARNYGMSIARGEYFIFIDSDILVPKNYLLELRRSRALSKKSIIIGLRLFLDEKTSFHNKVSEIVNDKSFIADNRLKMEGFRYRVFRDLSYSSNAMKYPFLFAQTCNFAVPSCCINDIAFDEDMIDWGIEDIEFAYKLYEKGVNITFNNRMEVFHMYHNDEEAGDSVEEYKMDGMRRNTKIFFEKHGNLFGITEQDSVLLFSNLATDYVKIENIPTGKKVIQFEYYEKMNLNEFVNQVTNASRNEELEIHVYDYAELDDLDIIIQLIDTPFKNLRYYPCSKVKEIKRMEYAISN